MHITCSGDLSKTMKFLNRLQHKDYLNILSKYGQRGVESLRESTPKDTGRTAASWYYDIEITNKGVSLTWRNNNIPKTIPIVLLIEYGHANQNGTFVEGRPFIADAIKPIFDKLSKDAWKEVTGK